MTSLITDGSACHCFDFFGATCIATCAADIADYSVKTMTGKNEIEVKCPSGTTVLGCGIKPYGYVGADFQRHLYVKNYQACTCSDTSGADCYATCGRL